MRNSFSRYSGGPQLVRLRPLLILIPILTGTLLLLIFYSGGFRVKNVIERGFEKVPTSLVESLNLNGKNIFTINGGEIERKLGENVWVKKVKIVKKLPSTIIIDLRERVPCAIMVFGGSLVYLDQDGDPFKIVSHGEPKDLPLAIGFKEDEGKKVVELLNRIKTKKHLGSIKISHLLKQDPDILIFTTEGTELILNGSDLDGSLNRLEKFLKYLSEKNWPLPRTIDARFQGRVICGR